MNVKRKIGAIGISFVVFFGTGSVAFAMPAFPGANGVCNNYGEFCVWNNSNGTGGIGGTPNSVGNYQDVGFWGSTYNANDKVSLVETHWVTRSVSLFEHKVGDGGFMVCMPVGLPYGYSFAGHPFNDKLSSHRNTTGTATC